MTREMRTNGFTLLLLVALFVAAMCLLLLGCGTVETRITPDGCVLAGTETEHGRVYAGVCEDGRQVAEWQSTQDDGTPMTIRATRDEETGWAVSYWAGGGWIEWSEKAGVRIGPVPAAVELELE